MTTRRLFFPNGARTAFDAPVPHPYGPRPVRLGVKGKGECPALGPFLIVHSLINIHDKPRPCILDAARRSLMVAAMAEPAIRLARSAMVRVRPICFMFMFFVPSHTDENGAPHSSTPGL